MLNILKIHQSKGQAPDETSSTEDIVGEQSGSQQNLFFDSTMFIVLIVSVSSILVILSFCIVFYNVYKKKNKIETATMGTMETKIIQKISNMDISEFYI